MIGTASDQPLRPFRVLTLDGGGMRGVYTATYLGELAEAFARKRHTAPLDVGKGFDLIVGTSTGGIVACALAAGAPLRDVVALYRDHGAAIFPMKLPTALGFSVISQLFTRRAALARGAQALHEVLEARFGNETLEGVYRRRGIALAIPAVEMNRNHSWVFKTPHHPNTNGRDNRYRLVDVCLATTAAPLFRSLAPINDPYGGPSYFVFADGGLWANNPVIVGLVEALEIAAPRQSIEIFALGTCARPAGQRIDRSAVNRGLLEWKFGGEAAAVSLDAQEFAFDNIARMLSGHLDRPCTVMRFPRAQIPADVLKYLDLDETRLEAAEALINQARHDVNMTNSAVTHITERAASSAAFSTTFPRWPCANPPHIHHELKGAGMFDCSKDVLSYHSDEVTLPVAEQNNMRERRDANRTRLKEGLKKARRPAPSTFETQGSYAMRTMIQLPRKNWDIDDGVYFKAADLKGERGGEMSALEARQMVRDALDDGSFRTKPEVRRNCVRVHYDAGYHVDIPVYRIRIEKDLFGNDVEIVELASTDWKRSDARDVTKWFNDENEKQSPDMDNGRQLRRVTRDGKKYAQSRDSWADKILSGFGITKLVTECFRGSATREDEALVNTLRAIRDRLELNLEIKHPVTPNETITKGPDDAPAKMLRDKIKEGLETLKILDDPSCTRTQALAAWDKFYATDYFTKRDATKARVTEAAAALTTPAILTSRTEAAPPPVRKDGGGRYA